MFPLLFFALAPDLSRPTEELNPLDGSKFRENKESQIEFI